MRGTNSVSTMIPVASGVLVTGLLLFLSAGTLAFWRGWLLLFVLLISYVAATIGQRYSKSKPDSDLPDIPCAVILFGAVVFDVALVAAGLNDRFRWIILPDWTSYGGAIMVLAAVFLCAAAKWQPDVETAHGTIPLPFYLSVLLLFLSVPLVLGSVISFLLILLTALFLFRWMLPTHLIDP